jgi:hypothetical protein
MRVVYERSVREECMRGVYKRSVHCLPDCQSTSSAPSAYSTLLDARRITLESAERPKSNFSLAHHFLLVFLFPALWISVTIIWTNVSLCCRYVAMCLCLGPKCRKGGDSSQYLYRLRTLATLRAHSALATLRAH